MCIAVFVWQNHPPYPFLLLKNRDEYHNKPTKKVGWWEDDEILGGRDEVAGGTWLACSRQGRIAFLTNVLEPNTIRNAKSRGDLPVRFLQSTKTPNEFAEEVAKVAYRYKGFNLILADINTKTMVYVSNRPEGEPITIQEVSPGIHVLANAKLDSPCHKTRRLRQGFKEYLTKYGKGDVPIKEMIEKLMRDPVKADKSELPKICSPDWEFNLSSVFVDMDTPLGRCGTRSTTALTYRENGEVNFYETYLEKKTWKEQTVIYNIKRPIVMSGQSIMS